MSTEPSQQKLATLYQPLQPSEVKARIQPLPSYDKSTDLDLSKHRIVSILESISDAFLSLDDHWRYTYLNSQAERLTERKAQDLLGRCIWDEFPELVGSRFERECRRSLQEQEPVTLEEFSPRLNTWYEIRMYPVDGGLSLYLHDISDRKQAEAALRQQEAQYRSIFESTSDGLVIHDLETGEVIEANPAACRMHGYAYENFVGLHPHTFIHANSLSSLEEIFATIQAGIQHECHLTIQRRNGTFFEAEVFGTSIYYDAKLCALLVIRDVSERRQAEVAIQASEAKFRKLAQQEAVINHISNQIRQSLDLNTILETATEEIRQLLLVDRCQLVRCKLEGNFAHCVVVQEAKHPALPSHVGMAHSIQLEPGCCLLLQSLVRLDDCQMVSNLDFRQFLEAAGYRATLGVTVQTRSNELSFVTCHHNHARCWSDEEIALLQSVTSQLAIAIDHAEVYNQARTAAELATAKSQELALALHELTQTQAQLVQNEKLSSLGQMVAGIAHEINNPVSFIYGNVCYADQYATELLELLKLYQQHYPEPIAAIQQKAQEIDLEFLEDDLPQVLKSMQLGADRINDIVRSLRVFSRLDEADKKQVDVHEGLDSTLMILQHRLKSTPARPAIQVVKEYGELPLVECYAGQLNQVFMNLLVNAIDALETTFKTGSTQETLTNADTQSTHSTLEQVPPTIWIRTAVIADERIEISIIDNGPGMPEEVRSRLFDPFFTTKPVGEGTGLGLATSYQIIVEKHLGQLSCISEPGQGAKFVVEIPIVSIDTDE
jgi:two-component system, NtrC family, sensor kinase